MLITLLFIFLTVEYSVGKYRILITDVSGKVGVTVYLLHHLIDIGRGGLHNVYSMGTPSLETGQSVFTDYQNISNFRLHKL